jgi:hypothetical protein
MKTIDFEKTFGKPLNEIKTNSHQFLLKKSHIIIGVIIFGLSAYGGYSLYKDIKSKFFVPKYFS